LGVCRSWQTPNIYMGNFLQTKHMNCSPKCEEVIRHIDIQPVAMKL
jgi:hypothetical protein